MKISTDRFRLSFRTDPQFHTTVSRKTGQKVVTCTLNAVIHQPIVDDGDSFQVFPWYTGENCISVTARAVCSANDSYAVEVGKAVAQAKAESRVYAKANKLISDRINAATKMLYTAREEFANKANMVVAHNVQYVDDVTNPETDLYKRKTQTC